MSAELVTKRIKSTWVQRMYSYCAENIKQRTQKRMELRVNDSADLHTLPKLRKITNKLNSNRNRFCHDRESQTSCQRDIQKYYMTSSIWCQVNLDFNDKSKHSASEKYHQVFHIHDRCIWLISVNRCWNTAFDCLFVLGIRIKPPMLNRRSTGVQGLNYRHRRLRNAGGWRVQGPLAAGEKDILALGPKMSPEQGPYGVFCRGMGQNLNYAAAGV